MLLPLLLNNLLTSGGTTYEQAVGDTFTAVENLSRQTQQILAEAATLTEADAAQIQKALSEAADLAESLHFQVQKLFSEAENPSETLGKSAEYALALSDSLNASEALLRQIDGHLAEAAGLTENLSAIVTVFADITVEIDAGTTFAAALEIVAIQTFSTGSNYAFPRLRRPKAPRYADIWFAIAGTTAFVPKIEINNIALTRARRADEEWLMVA